MSRLEFKKEPPIKHGQKPAITFFTVITFCPWYPTHPLPSVDSYNFTAGTLGAFIFLDYFKQWYLSRLFFPVFLL